LAAIVRPGAFDPRRKALAPIVAGHQPGERFALDLETLADGHIHSAGHGGEDAGIRGISVDAVAAKAGVTKRTLTSGAPQRRP
jgi:hypothetical protein